MKKERISKEWLFSDNNCEDYRLIDLPHDYSVTTVRKPDYVDGASMGFFGGGEGRYKKFFGGLGAEHTILDIDGAYMCARVSVNENLLEMHPYGYTPFLVDLTGKVNNDKPNKIEILTQNLQPSTRWYSGAGIYRDVYLWTGGKVRIEPWDMFVTTKSIGENSADINVSVKITSDIDGVIVLKNKICDGNGNTAAEQELEVTVNKGKNKIDLPYTIASPMLWDTENPNLYTINSEIVYEGKFEDEFEQNFGIRTISADAENGLLLNGKAIKLRGGCIHHDHGALGAAAFPAAEYRKLKKLKDVGYNAIRTAHNPPSLSQLEICDRLGMIVMDEAFDMWNMPKRGFDYSLWFKDWYARDIESMVLRDRNHPSVISYSIGNEIEERDSRSDGAVWSEILSNEIRRHDNTRLVTSGVCGFWLTPDKDAPKGYDDSNKGMFDTFENEIDYWAEKTKDYAAPLDIVGYNYLYERYEYDHEKFPERVIWGSETHALNIYHSWEKVKKHNYVIGDFTWTAYDNLGEAGTGRSLWARDGEIKGISLADYPWRTCYQGDFDLCGYRRPQSYFRERVWKENCPPKAFTTHPMHYGEGFTGTEWHWYDVCDTWTYPDEYIGKPVKTDVYTDAEEVKFILNGELIGTAKQEFGVATLDVPYQRGELKVEAYKNGVKIGEDMLKTIGEAERVEVIAEAAAFAADNRDLCYFDIAITDTYGNRVTDADCEIFCSCEGGELMCVFSGNPANEDQYGSNSCHVFYGRAVAVVRTKNPGKVTLTAISKGLKSGTAEVEAK